MLITLEEAKTYLRVDSILEEPLILSLLPAAEKMVMDVARLDAGQWETVCDPQTESLMLRGTLLSHAEIMMIRDLLRTAVFFTLGYLYEHREEADHHELVLTLRNLLFSIREGVL